MTAPDAPAAGATDRAFALLQELLPQQLLSRGMHRLARSKRPGVRNLAVRLLLRSYPQIDPGEAAESDPYRYPSFNAFFTRALRAGVRPVVAGPDALVSPVDGALSQFGDLDAGRLLQAKGIEYTAAALLGSESAAAQYTDGRYACMYLAPFDYHRIHMPIDGRLRSTRYVPGRLFSVNASTARTIPGLFGINERVVCEFDTRCGALALVMVGALFVGSIETVPAGEINPPPVRGGAAREVIAGRGLSSRRARSSALQHGLHGGAAWQRALGAFAPGLASAHGCAWVELLAGTARRREREWQPTADIATLQLRATLLARARDYFAETGALEVETPIAGPRRRHRPPPRIARGAPRRRRARRLSPHLARIRDEAAARAGAPDIYQIAHVFREGERGRRHNPEFTMIEWYRLGIDITHSWTMSSGC